METVAYIGIAIAAITAVGVFVGPMLATRLQEIRRERDKKLRTHFENLKLEIMEPIRDLTWQLKNREGKLSFGDFYPSVLPSYEFERRDPYAYFSLHFPAIADEWKQLKEKALKHNERYKELEDEKDRKELFDNAERLAKDFKEFSLRLAADIDNISKYEMGKRFKKHKECPICQKL